MKSTGFVLFALLLAAPLGFPQDSGSGSSSASNGSASSSNSNSGATAVINNNSTSGRQFTQASPSVFNPGPFPGYPIENGQWRIYRPAPFRKVTLDMARAMCKGGYKVISRKWIDLPESSDSVNLLNWSPELTAYAEDKIVGVVEAFGKYRHLDEETLGCGLAEAMEKNRAKRAVVLVRIMNEGVTKGFSIGSGGSFSRIADPTGDNNAIAVATGGVLGTNRVRREDHPEFKIICLNDGPSEPPAMPQPQKAQAAPPPPPPPPVQTVRIEVVSVPPPQPIAQAPVRSAPLPAVDPCPELLKGTVNFAYDRYSVEPEYLPVIQSVADWMRVHPSCKISVEGYASVEGPDSYNDWLGEQRAQHVYDILAKNKDIADRLPVYLSGGKRFVIHKTPRSERNKEDRKVIFAVHNVTSE